MSFVLQSIMESNTALITNHAHPFRRFQRKILDAVYEDTNDNADAIKKKVSEKNQDQDTDE